MHGIAALKPLGRHRVVLAIAAVLTVVATGAGPAAADPPESSGVVERVLAPDGWLFPDPANGLAVFVNVTREAVCDSGAPEGELSFQFVNSPSSAQLLLEKGSDLPISLHRFAGGVPSGPCAEEIEDEPALVGTVGLVGNDNETCPCQNNRTNSFGVQGEGTVRSTADGGAWQYSWHQRLLIDENDAFRVASEHYTLRPIGG